MNVFVLLTAAQAAGVETAKESDKLEVVIQKLLDWGMEAGFRILMAVLIFVVGRFLISFINKMVARLLVRRKVEPSVQSFLKSMVSILLMALLMIITVYPFLYVLFASLSTPSEFIAHIISFTLEFNCRHAFGQGDFSHCVGKLNFTARTRLSVFENFKNLGWQDTSVQY